MANVNVIGRYMYVDDLSKLDDVFSDVLICGCCNSMNLQVVLLRVLL